MAKYADVTRFIDELDTANGDKLDRVLHGPFLSACYESRVVDGSYSSTLKSAGIHGAHINSDIESLDLRTVRALLTYEIRYDRLTGGPHPEYVLLWDVELGYLQRLLRRIAELDGTWVRPDVVTFNREHEKYSFLSNSYESPFTFRENVFLTGVHWMMWQKAQLLGDERNAEKILKSTDVEDVRQLGKQLRGCSDEAWDAVRMQIMRVGLRHKFAQSIRLRQDLFSTGSAELVEATPNDKDSGADFAKRNSDPDDPSSLHGSNPLGITLMNVRSELRNLLSMGEKLDWDVDLVRNSHVWEMSLVELECMPTTRQVVLMYAQMAKQYAPERFQDAEDALRKIEGSVRAIDGRMHFVHGCGLPPAGWQVLLDELAFQVRMGILE